MPKLNVEEKILRDRLKCLERLRNYYCKHLIEDFLDGSDLDEAVFDAIRRIESKLKNGEIK